MTLRPIRWLALATVLFTLFGLAWLPAASAQSARERIPLLPIVFVHGSSGSAAQFETQAMRFTSNGYPQALLYAFDYDTSVALTENAAQVQAQLDAFIDDVLEETGASQVNAIGHSRGTFVWTTYLDNYPGGAAKVARYANLDGRSQPTLPGGVPTIGVWGEWNSGGEYARVPGLTQIGPDPANNFHYPNKGHTEVATSAEAFARMYRFFTGVAPATTDVVPEAPNRVTVAGRAVVFPQNTGYAGATLELWRLHDRSGQRVGRRPLWSQTLDASGEFGPLPVNGLKHYEFALVREDGSVHHFYQQPFTRSNHFLRLNTSVPNTGLEAFVPKGDFSQALVFSRQREFWGDQGHLTDLLSINGAQLLTPAIAPRTGVTIGVYAYDQGLDGQSDLGKGELFPFNAITFISAGDLFIPAAPNGEGTTRVRLQPRGSGQLIELNVPNWPSSRHRVSVQFRDFVQRQYDFADYPRHWAR